MIFQPIRTRTRADRLGHLFERKAEEGQTIHQLQLVSRLDLQLSVKVFVANLNDGHKLIKDFNWEFI